MANHVLRGDEGVIDGHQFDIIPCKGNSSNKSANATEPWKN